jgi:hypothetical protein
VSEDRALEDAEWVDRRKQVFQRDLENYSLLAESLGCSCQEVMMLQGLSMLMAMGEEMFAASHYLRDMHQAQFPELWKESDADNSDGA